MESQTRIGFVGVGRMGANMARCLKEKGYTVAAVQDRRPGAAQSLARELSCQAVSSPAQVAESCGVVLTVVTDDAAMDAVFSEQDSSGLLAHARDRLFINFATVSPETHIETEGRVRRHGGRNLEALMASSIP